MSKKPEYLAPFDAIEVKQGNYTFYLFSMDARQLLEIAYTSERTKNNRKGVQRALSTDRLEEIGKYYLDTTRPGILPNSIIVSLSDDAHFKEGKLHIPRRPRGEAFVLDGQHRLFAFLPEYAGDMSMQLPVSAFLNIDDKMKAYIFRTINSKQRKINPSLVYDLIPMLRKDWVDFEDYRAQTIFESLNIDLDSPWREGIDVLGGRERPITQASFITRLKTLFKRGNVFEDDPDNDFYEESIQIKLLKVYFEAVKETYPKAWLNKNYILCKNTGFATMLNLLQPIISAMKKKNKLLTDAKGLRLAKQDFLPYLKKISTFSFSAEEYGKRYLGEVGIRTLSSELQDKMLPR
jgi:DGQHR domain-containing protein